MAARDVLKNINLFVDGRGYAGQIEELNPPKQTLKLEEFMGGGMAAPVEITMGMEKLESDFSLIAYDSDVLANFGVVEGREIQFTIRAHLESFDGSTSAVVMNMRGKIKEIDRGTWKAGEKATLKVALALTYFKETRGAVVQSEIDVVNMVFKAGGIDLLAGARSALGI